MKLQAAPSLKIPAIIAAALAFLDLAHAQDAVALEDAQKIAHQLTAMVNAISDLPFTVDTDADRPAGLKGGDAGLILVPDRRLTTEAVANAGKEFLPVAQLWSHKITVARDGAGFASEKLRLLTVGEGERARDVQFFLLGVAKNGQGALELAIFGRGREPLVRVPLQKRESGAQDFPIEVTGEKTGEGSARLSINLLGAFTADLDVVKADN